MQADPATFDPTAFDPAALDPLAMVASCLPVLVVCVGLYAYFALCLMTIARKTGTPGAGLAWIPIANIVLMCRIARKPGWWVLLALIPIVNFVAMIVLFMGMAEARGKSPGLAFLLFVPVVGLVVPLLLAAGGESRPATGAAAAGPAPGVAPPPPGPAPAAPRLTTCPRCSSEVGPEDAFCGECGQGLAEARAAAEVAQDDLPLGSAGGYPPGYEPALPPTKKGSAVPAVLGVGCLVILVGLAGAGWWAYSSFMGGGTDEADREAPAIPARAAGSMAEFPVDTDPTAPARPTSVVRQSFEDGVVDDGAEQIPDEWLPPGLPKQELARQATAVTSAPYRIEPTRPAVPVHVIETPPTRHEPARGIAGKVQAASGPQARMSGVNVTTPSGRVYPGYKVDTPQQRVIVLENPQASTVIVIYATEPSTFPVADRLAANVANGNGLMDYPTLSRPVSILPQRPPAGLELDQLATYLPADLGLAPHQIADQIGADAPQEAKAVVAQLQRFIPDRITTAVYRDPSKRRWEVLSGDYGSAVKAFGVWLLIRSLGEAAMDSIDVGGKKGMWIDEGDGPILLVPAGSSIIAMKAPPGEAVQKLVSFSGTLQK